MEKIKLDSRIKQLINGAVAANHRAMFVVIGNDAKKQVPILHHVLQRAKDNDVDNLPVLWVSKKDANICSRKQLKHLQKRVNAGQLNFEADDPFDLFLSSKVIRTCHYNETQKVLGQTYGMCVLQDFECLTPNALARTVETVSGGGLIVFLLPSIKSLKEIYHMQMDVHSHYRTESHSNVMGRFNERFFLSMVNCSSCLVTDDELRILPFSSASCVPKDSVASVFDETAAIENLRKIVESKENVDKFVRVVAHCVTDDQANAVIKFIECLSDRASPSTVVTTAARGRGKSAALGLGLACAVALGYSRIFVTAPNPENLSTVFEFLCQGLESMKYKLNSDYEITRSDLPEFNKAIVNVTILKSHRQMVQYVEPSSCDRLGQPDVVCIDEAAAIPLPVVKKFLGPYKVFMSSTINGYEGTGRSLSLKLINDMRRQSTSSLAKTSDKKSTKHQIDKSTQACQTLYEISLQHSIRYSDGDPIECWLYDLLCLDVSEMSCFSSSYPPAAQCQLFYVSRDTLFSYHEKSEEFLKRLVSIYVSSHYKNTPNDLQMLADAPAHHIFCLLGPKVTDNELPDILCVLQIAFEGRISEDSVNKNLQRGERASGDMIPWTIEQQFGGYNFAKKSGLRIVRIATHPDCQGMGYGSRTLELLQEYFEGKIPSLPLVETQKQEPSTEATLLSCEKLEPKENLPSLLVNLGHRVPEQLDYIGVSFGLTPELLKFWKRFGMLALYVRQTANDLTGEHSCIMLKRISSTKDVQTDESSDWLKEMWMDFRKRFLRLLSHDFRSWRVSTALDIVHHQSIKVPVECLSPSELRLFVSQSDVLRLEKYSNNLVDYRLIKDLIQPLANLYFCRCLEVNLNAIKSAILLGVGLQGKSIDDLVKEFSSKDRSFAPAQCLGLLHQTIKNLVQGLEVKKQNSEVPKKSEKMNQEEQNDTRKRKNKSAERSESLKAKKSDLL